MEAKEFDEALEKQIEANDGDISKVYNSLQEEYLAKYNRLIKLFNEERDQRQLLGYYKRRNNAILDVLAEAEPQTKDISEDELKSRIENLIQLNPNLSELLVLKDLASMPISQNLKLSMVLDESVTDLAIDDLVDIEKNPQDVELWMRRNYSNLVLSRFKPVFFDKDKFRKIDSPLNYTLSNHINLNNKKRKKAEK